MFVLSVHWSVFFLYIFFFVKYNLKYINLKYTIQNVYSTLNKLVQLEHFEFYMLLNIKESTLRVSPTGQLVNVY